MFVMSRVDSNDARSARMYAAVCATIGPGAPSGAEAYEAKAREYRARADANGQLAQVLGAGAFAAGLMKSPKVGTMLAGGAMAANAVAKADSERAKAAEAKAAEIREAERQEAARQEAARQEAARQDAQQRENERQAAEKKARDKQFEDHLRDRMTHDRGDTYGGRASEVRPDRVDRVGRTC